MASPAPAARSMINEADVLWPDRIDASDGIMGDPAHAARVSDHNDGNAVDLTHDPKGGVDCNALAEQLRVKAKAGRDARIKYIIWNDRISSEVDDWAWRPYQPQNSGRNKHEHHMHVSIHATRRDDVSPWFVKKKEGFVMDEDAKKAFADLVTRVNAVASEVRQVKATVVAHETNDKARHASETCQFKPCCAAEK